MPFNRTQRSPPEVSQKGSDLVSYNTLKKYSYHPAGESALAEKDEDGDIVHDTKGRPHPDGDLRDFQNIPLKEDIDDYFEREVKPYVDDALSNEDYTRVGYEIPFTRYFYEYEPPSPVEEIAAEIQQLEGEIQELLQEVVV